MKPREVVNRALVRIAGVLVERDAKVNLNGILDARGGARRLGYRRWYNDGLTGSDKTRSGKAEWEPELRLWELGFGE